MFNRKNLRNSTVSRRRVRLYLTGAACCTATLCVLLNAQAQMREIAEIEAQPQHRAKATPSPTPTSQPTPPALPAIPSGLRIGGRQIDRYDVGEYYSLHNIPQPFGSVGSPAASERNSVNVAAFTPQAKPGTIARSFAPLWLDSPEATHVSVSLGEGALSLDAIRTDDDVVSVTVRDEQGGAVTVAQRAYKVNGQTESIDGTVRVDADGRLLALPVVRLEQAQDGSVRAIRDGNFSEAVTVEFRLVRVGTPAYVATATRFVTIPAGAATSAPSPIQGAKGDVLTLRAGNGYTPAPAEGSDVFTFASSK